MSDVVERAKRSLNIYEYCRAAGVEMGAYPDNLVRELVAEVERLRAEKLGLEISESNLLVELRNEVERLRPRVIETVEQLDALPEGSIVEAVIGVPEVKWDGCWYAMTADAFEPDLPAHVLYIPEVGK
ncbi:hypothetical protein SEA_SANDALPHON_53 [Mycobacterium phage Sandalphon]|uniref:Uncharacterized protein n=19 Tax=Cheoctovirus TaxID=1623281 RepID=A0A249XQ21_9CAUD|nr:hypothetical protein BOOMER_53 [Mycobacterium phage Boomer]YP_002241630.1 gp46 [Mycobacterium phage Pacc40]YP_008126641.1 hypothetical protein M609_gp051 [Mycobacterium phage Job42]YP_008410615.1 hypothetical protein N856_gp046 [Mycobacterium phage Daenerys]YP_009636115.1 hypothetical protein FGG57_gp051 [Mycobacterium phage RockyHorror]YP_009954736.1 hypothetical protein I5H15_gp049 [Mycobacterium phage Blexus]YP_009954948.1 hypothetical protein I5H17_gp052 [Mycobacterium phage BodEinwohn